MTGPKKSYEDEAGELYAMSRNKAFPEEWRLTLRRLARRMRDASRFKRQAYAHLNEIASPDEAYVRVHDFWDAIDDDRLQYKAVDSYD